MKEITLAISLSLATVLMTCGGQLAHCAKYQESFSEAFERVNENKNIQDAEIRKQAEEAVSNKEWNRATAAYLVEAAHALKSGSFERSRPYFDQAFLAAKHLDGPIQEQVLQKLSSIISDPRLRVDYGEHSQYFAQKRLQLLNKTESTELQSRKLPPKLLPYFLRMSKQLN